jgi:PAS domain-containing protein
VTYTDITVRGTVLLTFPPEDVAFAAHARRLAGGVAGHDPRALESQLRELYPRAMVRERETLASFGERAWYVYREGRYSPFADGPPWWQAPGTACFTFGADGRYVDGNEAALAIYSVTLDELRASRAGEFGTEAQRDTIPWVLQLLTDTGMIHTTAVIRPRDGGRDRLVEVRVERDPTDRGRWISWMRVLPDDEAFPS